MKRVWLVVLTVVNLGLLAWVLNVTLPTLHGQVRGNADYLAVTGRIGGTANALYIVDLGKRRMLAWRFDETSKRMVPVKGVDLARDFKRDKER
jgi:hypothetical protein